MHENKARSCTAPQPAGQEQSPDENRVRTRSRRDGSTTMKETGMSYSSVFFPPDLKRGEEEDGAAGEVNRH
jgi:hypothetical protein